MILRNSIDRYLEVSAFVPALTLMQTYAELMYSETVSFQERYGFNAKTFTSWQREIAMTLYQKSRTLDLNRDSH